MVAEGRIKQKRHENQVKVESKLHELEANTRVNVQQELRNVKLWQCGGMFTGQSATVLKEIDSLVIGGTINFNGLLQVRATKIGSDTVLSQINSLVETAQISKAPIQKFADYEVYFLDYQCLEIWWRLERLKRLEAGAFKEAIWCLRDHLKKPEIVPAHGILEGWSPVALGPNSLWMK